MFSYYYNILNPSNNLTTFDFTILLFFDQYTGIYSY